MNDNPEELLKELEQNEKYVFIPFMTREKMAEYSGLTTGQVFSMIQRGTLPVYKVGRVNLVNIARLFTQQKLKNGYPSNLTPLLVYINKKRFSKLVGITEGQLLGWINRGYLPTIKLGKHRLIDVPKLFVHCSVNSKCIPFVE